MNRVRAVLACAAFLAIATATPADDHPLLLGRSYPLELAVLEHVGRFHWLDSLAGLELPGGSAGKTVDAHRAEFLRLLGPPTETDRMLLRRFAEVRARFAETRVLAWEHGDDSADVSALLIAFLEADDEATALAAASALLSDTEFEALAAALDHFRARYAIVWRAGTWSEPFLRDLRVGSDARRLGDDLRSLARFYRTSVPLDPAPRVVLVPVPAGSGTHATARGRNLLIELRPADRLVDAASVLAHENAHLLFDRMPGRTRDAVEAIFLAHGDAGVRAWDLLREALPTALGQGVIDRKYRPEVWTADAPWYHREEIDRYAKAIFPIVLRAFESGRSLDRRLARELWAACPERAGVTLR